MAGNFSFGDYFKETAIPLAWELLTNSIDQGGYGFDPERLWVTVFQDDDEGAKRFGARSWVCRTEQYPATRECLTTTGQWGSPVRAAPVRRSTLTAGLSYGVEGGPIADENRYLRGLESGLHAV